MREPRVVARAATWVMLTAIVLVSYLASKALVGQFGPQLFVFALVGVLGIALFALASFRRLMVPFIVAILTIGGFRFLWSVQSPVLPDLYLDRVMLMWLSVVFLIRIVAERRAPAGPFHLDLLMLVHGLYILVRIYTQDMEYIFQWLMSIAIPYAMYFFAKNIVDTEQRLRTLLWTMMALLAYYSVTSIAEKYEVGALVFPRSILTIKSIEFPGRSIGPFTHPGVFGTAFAMLIPIQLYFIATVRSLLPRSVIIALFLASWLGLYFTYTRGSWLAGVVGLLTVVALNRRHYFKIVAPAGIVAAILAVFALGLNQDPVMKERVENEDTLGSRIGTAVTALRVWRDHPLIGVGFFQFREVREHYIQPVEAPLLGTIQFSQFRHNNIHDIYLGPLAEDGIIGAAMQGGIYALILMTFLRKYRWRHHGDHFATYLMPVFGGIFVAYLAGGLAFDYRYFSFTGTVFYMAAGILEGYRRVEPEHVP